jgi:hypothetical protein
MRGISLLCAVAIFNLGGIAQMSPNEHSLVNSGVIFRKVLDSDLIVVGSVIKREGVAKHLNREQVKKVDDLSKTLGGTLYTIEVESLVCAKSDLKAGAVRPQIARKDVYVFVKRDAPMFQNGNRREEFREKERYLVLLTAIPEQAALVENYSLDPKNVYYRAVNGESGVISIPDDKNRVLSDLRRFCGALAPSDSDGKLKLLDLLKRSSEGDLRQSAEDALTLLKGQIQK